MRHTDPIRTRRMLAYRRDLFHPRFGVARRHAHSLRLARAFMLSIRGRLNGRGEGRNGYVLTLSDDYHEVREIV